MPGRFTAAAVALTAAFVGHAASQNTFGNDSVVYDPETFYHNRYHGLLAMSVYGDYNTTCPNQTFTTASELMNFPNTTRPPWTVIETWGPTPSGAQGYSAIIPEMNKVVVVFSGNYDLEQNLPVAVSSWSGISSALGDTCNGCTVNSFALQGYLEAKAATNNWAATKNTYAGSGFVYSTTGHGLGGMHSQIAAIDANQEGICYYAHCFGTPRTFNQAGAKYYNYQFPGVNGERGISNNDQYTDSIPASDNYYHAGTGFYYYGVNTTNEPQPNWSICWDTQTGNPDNPDCLAQPQASLNTTTVEDHYFYFTPVAQCGKPESYDVAPVDAFLAFEEATPANSAAPFSWSSPTPTHTTYSTSSKTSSSKDYTSTSQYYVKARKYLPL